jgi:hypothetical protein
MLWRLAFFGALTVSVGLAGAAAEQSSATRTDSSGTGMVTGRVIDGATRQAIPYADVAIRSYRAPVVRVRTDTMGRFMIRSAASEANRLWASKPGYLDAGFGEETPPHEGTPIPLNIAVEPGGWTRDADIVLWPLASLSGTVRDESGRPVAGVLVRAQVVSTVLGQRVLADGSRAKTDDRGVYRLYGLRAGTYGIVALPRDLAAPSADGERRTYAPAYHASARSFSDGVPITLEYGDAREGVDITLPTTVPRTVRGRVLGPLQHFTGLVARLAPAGDQGVGRGGLARVSAISGDGTFEFRTVADGEYVLEVAAAWSSVRFPIIIGFSRQVRDPDGVVGVPRPFGCENDDLFTCFSQVPADAAYWGRTAVTVASDVEGLEIPLNRALSITGRIVLEPGTIGGLSPAPRAEPFGNAAEVNQSTGEFAINGLRPGRYVLGTYTRQGRAIRSIMWRGQDHAGLPIEVGPDDVTGVVITYTGQTAGLRGSVTRPTGAAETAAGVIYFPADPARWMSADGMGSVVVDDGGAYDLSEAGSVPLRAGDYYVLAVPASQRNRWREPGFFERAARVGTRVSLAWGETATQNLRLTDLSTR